MQVTNNSAPSYIHAGRDREAELCYGGAAEAGHIDAALRLALRHTAVALGAGAATGSKARPALIISALSYNPPYKPPYK